MARKKMLVLGATGFIGRNIAEYFAKSQEWELFGACRHPSGLVHPAITMVEADLTRKEDVERVMADMDLVIQAAAVTSGSKDVVSTPHIHITDNAIMNSLVFRAAFELSIPQVVFFSCTVMYHHSNSPLKEDDFDANREMISQYFGGGWNKVYFEKMCEFYSRLGRNRYTVIRHSNIYGPHDKYDLEKSHVFGATVAKVMTAPQGGTLTLWGSGEEGRDLLYISDLVEFVSLALQKQQSPFALYNAGAGCAVTIRSLVEQILDQSRKRLAIATDLSKPTIPTTVCLDCSRAEADLGWVPRVSLSEGIRLTLEWYRQQFPEQCR